MLRVYTLCLLLVISLQGFTQGNSVSFASYSTESRTYAPTAKKSFFRLGDRVVTLVRYGAEESEPWVLVSLHNNETTSIDAAKAFISRNGGTFYELANDGERNVSFELHDRKFVFDPNRIFTGKGRIANLKANRSMHNVSNTQVLLFARFVVNELPEDKIIIAVHNNTEGDFNLLSYMKGGALQKDARAVYQNNALDPDDFFLTTDENIFEKLKARNYNVVLQSKTPRDDGSLSVLLERENRSYINIETQHGHGAAQMEMLEAVKDILK